MCTLELCVPNVLHSSQYTCDLLQIDHDFLMVIPDYKLKMHY